VEGAAAAAAAGADAAGAGSEAARVGMGGGAAAPPLPARAALSPPRGRVLTASTSFLRSQRLLLEEERTPYTRWNISCSSRCAILLMRRTACRTLSTLKKLR
jgi:hypothetical protein